MRAAAIALALFVAGSGAAAIAASGKDHLPATGIAQTEDRSASEPHLRTARLAQPASSADPCAAAAWPHLPAECLSNVDPERARRVFRVIPIR